MIERLDHVVIVVPDLDAAVRDYQALGFDVRAGGEHVGRGTHNALVRFGLDYLELLAVRDAARTDLPAVAALTRLLAESRGGLAGYVVATSDLTATAERLQAAGLAVEGPVAMARQRPDGRTLSWRLLFPGGAARRQVVPRVIAWDQPDAERLAGEAAGGHPNGVQGVRAVAVVVDDLERGVDLCERQLGLPLLGRDEVIAWRALRATFALGDARLEVCAPNAPGLVAGKLAVLGEGIWQVTLGVASLAAARRALEERGVPLLPAPGVDGGLLIDPARAQQARLVLCESV